MKTRIGIVADGHLRARLANLPEVTAEVAAEYADELKNSSFFGRMRIHIVIAREVNKRLDQLAPSDALY